MSKMTESEKKAVPKSERGVPGKSGTGSYPMPDAAHAKAAVGLAAMHHGSGSSFTKKIKEKAHKLGFMGHVSEHSGDGHHASTHHGGHQTMHVHLHMGGKGKKKFSI